MTKKVLNKGSPEKSKIWIISDYPGYDEEKAEFPIAGNTLELLISILLRHGIDIHKDCYIANLYQYRIASLASIIADTALGDVPIRKDPFVTVLNTPQLEEGVTVIRHMLDTYQPNIVIGLGVWPMRYLTNVPELMKNPSIEQWRGSVIQTNNKVPHKFISVFHPRTIVTNQHDYPIFDNDISRAKRESDFPELKRRKREIIIVDNDLSLAQTAFHDIMMKPLVSVDIECGKEGILKCVGFAVSAERAYSFTVNNLVINSLITKMLVDNKLNKIFQFGTFDTLWLWRWKNITVEGFIHDTLLAQHVMWAELPRSLAYLTSVYTDLPYYKYMSHSQADDNKEWGAKVPIEQLCHYNALDCLATFEVHEAQMAEMAIGPSNWRETYDFEVSSLPMVHDIAKNGMPLDLEQLTILTTQTQAKVDNINTELTQLLGGNAINIKSPKQVISLLYRVLELPEKKAKGGSNLTTDEDALVSLMGYCANKISILSKPDAKLQWQVKLLILERILQLRGLHKMMNSYLLITYSQDKRLRSVFKIGGADTGRYSAEMFIDGTGINSQTFPRGDI